MNNRAHKLIIQQAMRSRKPVSMVYQNSRGEVREFEVIPTEWVNDFSFYGQLTTSGTSLRFNLNGILELNLVNAASGEEAPEDPIQYENTINVVPGLIQRVTTQTENSPKAVTSIKTRQDWSKLNHYLRECIVRENQNQFVIRNADLLISIPREQFKDWKDAYSNGEPIFIPTSQVLYRNFQPVDPYLENEIRLLNKVFQERKQLCIGEMFLVIDYQKIAPLFYIPLEIQIREISHITDKIKKPGQYYVLTPEPLQVSYAAFKELELEEEEISAFLEEIEQYGNQINLVQQAVINKIAQILGFEPPQVQDRIVPNTIYQKLCRFEVSDSRTTIQLILELSELTTSNIDLSPSNGLYNLLNAAPEHEYKIDETIHSDDLFVTPLYPRQIAALHSSLDEPVVVVTGPPGTGKSQLVLNILVNAFLKNKTVLFASKNNQAVDVVIKQLIDKLGFRGAVRVGNTQYVRDAATRMRKILSEISLPGDPSALNQPEAISAGLMECQKDLQELENLEKRLERLRDLKGKLESYQNEKDFYLKNLIQPLAALFQEEKLPHLTCNDFEILDEEISNLLMEAVSLAKKHDEWRSTVEVFLGLRLPSESPLPSELLIRTIQHILQQAPVLYNDSFKLPTGETSLQNELNIMLNWSNLGEWMEKEGKKKSLQLHIKELQLAHSSLMNQLHFPNVENVLNRMTRLSQETLQEIENNAQSVHQTAMMAIEGKMPWWWRLINWVSGEGMIKKEGKKFDQVLDASLIIYPNEIRQNLSAHKLRKWSEDVINGVKLARTSQALSKAFTELELIQQEITSLEEKFPPNIEPLLQVLGQEEVIFDPHQLDRTPAEIHALRNKIEQHTQNLSDLVGKYKLIRQRFSFLIHQNQRGLVSIERLSHSGIQEFESLSAFNGWDIPSQLEKYLISWNNFINVWNADSRITDFQTELEQLGNEDDILASLRQSQENLFNHSRRVLNAIWLSRVRNLPNPVLQRTAEYATAADNLSNDREGGVTRRELRNSLYERFDDVKKVFPIWATTNLSARNSFPLREKIFDIVIIDEASQCDIASAMPLLYRGKQMTIIGDPKQLRHVTTIQDTANQGAAGKYGVDPSVYNYAKQSLYDLAERSVGSKPGVILLNQHYRSDEKIISFSNKHFYNERLFIKTDLRRRYNNHRFVKEWRGLYWVDASIGEAERHNSSWINRGEVELSYQLIQNILQNLQNWNLGSSISIGVVTPFRQQADLLRYRLQNQNADITVGTAHTFQGDEKDIIVFSTVIAPGVEAGALKWLKQTENLLNVAITRARLSLFVVGNHNYCATNVEPAHPFRVFAEHVKQHGRVGRNVDELINGKQPFTVAGLFTRSDNLEYNRATLRRVLENCEEYIYWMDPYFLDKVFKMLIDVAQNRSWDVSEVRLLTGKEQTVGEGGRPPQLSFEKYKSARAKLRERGVSLKVRLTERDKLPHDRFLITANRSINMPPFKNAYDLHNRISEYTESHATPSLFQEYWQQAQDWDG